MTTVAIELHGTIRHGLWSPERGESRWAQNLAAVLGASGYDVIGFGPMAGNGWGVCPKVPGVRLVDWSEESNLDVDVFFDAAHWAGKPVRMKARHVLRGYFSPAPDTVAADWPANHHLAVPYHHLMPVFGDSRANPQVGNMALLPYVMTGSEWWRRYAPSAFLDVLPHQRTRILWGSKSAFGAGDSGDPHHIKWADAALDLMRGLKLDGWNPTFLGRQSFEPECSQIARDLGVLARAEAIGQVFAYLPFGQVLQMMRESVVAMTLPTWGSFALECVFENCVPVVWDTNPVLAQPAREMNLLVPVHPFSPARLREVVDLLLADRELRDLALSRYREELRWYTPEYALDCWRDLEARWLL